MLQYALEAKNLSFRYSHNSPFILKNINLKLRKGEITGIVGLSGSGKSTLIQILNGVIPKRVTGFLDGSVYLNGVDIADMELSYLARKIGTIFQDPDCQILFPCTEDEMAFGPENLCYEPYAIIERINSTAKMLAIEPLRYRNPNTVSGGEKQIIALASVLTLNVGIMIFDESMSFIDDRGKELIKNAILKLKKQGKSILMVEHDLSNLEVADHIFLLKNGTLEPFKGVIE
ncbi:MAG: ABC transporter related [Clostridiales bacterium 38_11]|nr:MAG: ABC transporter related [Clostridiales bacterium 38_11]HBH13696.1 ABC transporter ATP-binding protein [Clostridiales bacterium]